MKRTRLGLTLGVAAMLAGGALAEGCSGEAAPPASGEKSAAAVEGVEGQSAANAIVAAMRAHLSRVDRPKALGGGVDSGDALDSLLAPTNATISREGDALRLRSLEAPQVEKPASIRLAARANAAFRVEDETSRMAVEVRLAGATDAAAEISNGLAVYPGGYAGGAHLVHRATEIGTEDYLYFPKDLPAASEIRYEVSLDEHVAGLRLVGDTFEMLDEKGTPRLRMAPPYAIDGAGKYVALQVSVEGCAYDTDPRPTWGRAVVPAGASNCTVALQWRPEGVKAPLVVDPAWETTGELAVERSNHTATVLPSSIIIVTGGDGSQMTVLQSTEFFDSATRTWEAGPNMLEARSGHTATLFVDATAKPKLLVAGGKSNNAIPALESAEVYDMTSFVATPGMNASRANHAASLTKKGVLITGGRQEGVTLNSAELFDPATGTFSTTFNQALLTMKSVRCFHTQTTLEDGRVLVVGGEATIGQPLDTAELLDFATAAGTSELFASLPNMGIPRSKHTATLLSGGNVLVVGSKNASQEFIPGTKNWANPVNHANTLVKRVSHAASPAFLGTTVLVTGGIDLGTNFKLASTEYYDVNSHSWSLGPPMFRTRSNHAQVTLPKGGVVVAGGLHQGPESSPTSEILTYCFKDDDCLDTQYCNAKQSCVPKKANGQPCRPASQQNGGECAADNCSVCESGVCIQEDSNTAGICCNKACDGVCETCTDLVPGACLPVTGQPVKGSCPDFGEICGSACDGKDGSQCTFAKGNQCGTQCAGDAIDTLACDGAGKCETVTGTSSCAPFSCVSGMDTPATCKVDCKDTKTDCAAGYVCNPTSGVCNAQPTHCIDDNTMETETGDPKPCGLFKCELGACLQSCKTAYDCAQSPNSPDAIVCDEAGQCVPSDDVKNEASGSCSISVPGQTDSSTREHVLLALAAASILAARRKRAKA